MHNHKDYTANVLVMLSSSIVSFTKALLLSIPVTYNTGFGIFFCHQPKTVMSNLFGIYNISFDNLSIYYSSKTKCQQLSLGLGLKKSRNNSPLPVRVSSNDVQMIKQMKHNRSNTYFWMMKCKASMLICKNKWQVSIRWVKPQTGKPLNILYSLL